MHISYLVLAHARANHLRRLLDALDHQDACTYLHVDAKADLSAFDLPERDSLHLSRRRHRVHWGTFGLVEATVDMLRHALENEKSDYFALLSGACYPLLSPEAFRDLLSDPDRPLFIEADPMPLAHMPIRRLEKYALAPDLTLPEQLAIRAFRKFTFTKVRDYTKVLKHMKPWCGSQWWTLPRDAAEYIVEFWDANPAFVRYYRNTTVPDEMFFQTILANSPLAHRIRDTITYVDWSDRFAKNPPDLTKAHIDRLLPEKGTRSPDPAAPRYAFARKFPDEGEILTRIVDQRRARATSRPVARTAGKAAGISRVG